MDLFDFRDGVVMVGLFALLLFKVWAFVDAALRPSDAYVAADKLTKQAWLLLTGLSAAAAVFIPGFFIFTILGTVASIVYIVDVRPALVYVTRGRR
ncbi:DUF2516 family protein [Nocardioides marmoraquaticus]